MINVVLRAAAVVMLAGCLAAAQQDGPASPSKPVEVPGPAQVSGAARLGADASVDQVLDALYRSGQGLKDFTADVTLNETDTALGDTTSRSGTAVYQRKGEGDARIRVVFTSKRQGKKIVDQRMEYLLDNGWLTERDYARKSEIRRQVLRPGEKMDLLKLGEGPFPLPVGQPPESVKKVFEVTKVATDEKKDPADTVHIKLTPKADSQFAKKFSAIDVYVDTKTEMPRRIETLDVNETTKRSTDLKIKELNQGLKDTDFQLDQTVGEWDKRDEAYSE